MKPLGTLAGAATTIALVGTSAVSADAALRRRRFSAFLLALTLAVGFNVTRPTAAQKAALMKCLTALGATGLSGLVAPATGGASVAVFVFGVGSTLWGCT